jgi:pimeloyl-ACP methyl ester carboxylesterase
MGFAQASPLFLLNGAPGRLLKLYIHDNSSIENSILIIPSKILDKSRNLFYIIVNLVTCLVFLEEFMLYTLESGNKKNPAIVLLHGGGLSSKSWQPVIERLSNDFYCLAPDLPEQGQSFSVKPFTLDDSAAKVSEIILSKVPSKKAHLVGLSLGGALVVTMLRLNPEVINRAMVTGTAAKLSEGLGKFSISTLWILKLYSAKTLVEATIKQQGIPAQYRDLVYDDLMLTGPDRGFNESVIREIMNMELPLQNKTPLLACVGSKETIPARQAAKKLVKLVPNTKGVIIPGLNHVWALQDPDLFSQTVRAWVTEKPLPSTLIPIQ